MQTYACVAKPDALANRVGLAKPRTIVRERDVQHVSVATRAQHDSGVLVIRPAMLDRVLEERLKQKNRNEGVE